MRHPRSLSPKQRDIVLCLFNLWNAVAKIDFPYLGHKQDKQEAESLMPKTSNRGEDDVIAALSRLGTLWLCVRWSGSLTASFLSSLLVVMILYNLMIWSLGGRMLRSAVYYKCMRCRTADNQWFLGLLMDVSRFDLSSAMIQIQVQRWLTHKKNVGSVIKYWSGKVSVRLKTRKHGSSDSWIFWPEDSGVTFWSILFVPLAFSCLAERVWIKG